MKRPLQPVFLILILALVDCSNNSEEKVLINTFRSSSSESLYTGTVYLYGESHGVQKSIEKELELWQQHYKSGARDLFLELPYYTSALLNVWMREPSNSLLDKIYADWDRTASHNEYTLEFLKDIKATCPLTVFHGTDVGHQYNTTGAWYLKYLIDKGLENTEQYRLAKEAVDQGRKFYLDEDPVYRENTMVENFRRELVGLRNTAIMGIYGSSHTNLKGMDYSGAVPCMANQLSSDLGNQLHSEDLSPLEKQIEPTRTDWFDIGDRKIKGSYYGRQDIHGMKNFSFREFWRLEGAYDFFKDRPRTGNVLPFNNYPMEVGLNEVFQIDYTLLNGTTRREYLVSAGAIWQGLETTEEVLVR